MHETFSTTCRDLAKAKRAWGKKASIYLYVRKPHLVMANRCAKPLEEAGRAGLMDATWLGRHTLGDHQGISQGLG